MLFQNNNKIENMQFKKRGVEPQQIYGDIRQMEEKSGSKKHSRSVDNRVS